MDRVKADLTWWTSGAQAAQLLIDGEVDAGTCWNGRLFKPKGDGAPIDYSFDHALYVCDAMVVPKGAPNRKLAMEFLANMMDAKNQATFANAIPYGPAPAQLAAKQRHGRDPGFRLLGRERDAGVRTLQPMAARLSPSGS